MTHQSLEINANPANNPTVPSGLTSGQKVAISAISAFLLLAVIVAILLIIYPPAAPSASMAFGPFVGC